MQSERQKDPAHGALNAAVERVLETPLLGNGALTPEHAARNISRLQHPGSGLLEALEALLCSLVAAELFIEVLHTDMSAHRERRLPPQLPAEGAVVAK